MQVVCASGHYHQMHSLLTLTRWTNECKEQTNQMNERKNILQPTNGMSSKGSKLTYHYNWWTNWLPAMVTMTMTTGKLAMAKAYHFFCNLTLLHLEDNKNGDNNASTINQMPTLSFTLFYMGSMCLQSPPLSKLSFNPSHTNEWTKQMNEGKNVCTLVQSLNRTKPGSNLTC